MDNILKLFGGYPPGQSPLAGNIPSQPSALDYLEVSAALKAKGQTPVSAASQARKNLAYNGALFLEGGGMLKPEEVDEREGLPPGRAQSVLELLAERGVSADRAFFAYYGKPLEIYCFCPSQLVWNDLDGILRQRSSYPEWTKRQRRIYRFRAGGLLRSGSVAIAALRLELAAEGGLQIMEGESIDFFPLTF